MTEATAPPQLQRALGLRDVILFFVTAGTNLQWVATAAAAGPSSLVVWVLGAFMMFLPLSVCVVFLSSRHPDQGGLYVWSKRAFGPFTGFMTGWLYWTSNLPYFPGLLYFAAGNALFLSGRSVDPSAASPAYFIGFALAGLALGTALNVRGLSTAKWLNNLGAVMRMVTTVLLIGLGRAVWWRFGSSTVMNRHTLTPGFSLTDAIFWTTIAFAWTGPECASFMGGEIRDAQRTIPRAFAAAAPMIAAIYLISTLSILVTLAPDHTSALYGVMQAVSSGAHRLGIAWLIPIAAVCVTIACVASVGAWLGGVARIPFVAGIDHYLPKAFAKLHPRHGSPNVAIVTQALIAGVFVFLGQAGTSVKGAYDVLVSMMVIAVMLPFVPLFAAAIRLSSGAPVPGEIRIPGGRITIVVMASLGLTTTLGSVVLAMIPRPDDPDPSLAVLKIVGVTGLVALAGAAVYLNGRMRARRYQSAASISTVVP